MVSVCAPANPEGKPPKGKALVCMPRCFLEPINALLVINKAFTCRPAPELGLQKTAHLLSVRP